MESVVETNKQELDWQRVPILITDKKGKNLSPFVPNWENLEIRLFGDISSYMNGVEITRNQRGLLEIEENEELMIDNMFEDVTNIIQDSKDGHLPTKEDLVIFATYLDWSYQQQIGVPASSSNYDIAKSNGVGAGSVWLLFTSIKNKLENENQKENVDRRI